MQDFHKVRAWRKATRLAIAIRGLVATFPRRGYARLKDQMIRAAESIPDNIAEGCGTDTVPDFVRFLNSAIKSSNELESQLDRSFGCSLMNKAAWQRYTAAVQTIRKMTVGFRKSVLRNGAPSDADLLADETLTANGDNGQ